MPSARNAFLRTETAENVVGTAEGDLVEVQGTAEGAPFSRAQLDEMMDLAQKGIGELVQAQLGVLE